MSEEGEDPRHGRSEDAHGQQHHDDHLDEVPPERALRPAVSRSIDFHVNVHDHRLPSEPSMGRSCRDPPHRDGSRGVHASSGGCPSFLTLLRSADRSADPIDAETATDRRQADPDDRHGHDPHLLPVPGAACWIAPVAHTFSPVEQSGQGRWTLLRKDQRKPWAERDHRPYAEALLLPNLDAGVGLR